ncbi:hypothetical protein Hanom_Chr08g00731511 [Helianthus anomalus]
MVVTVRGVGVGTSDKISLLTNIQSSSDMSSTIFLSLTTFFSGNGHHLLPHPTISPQPTISHTKSIHHALILSRVILFSIFHAL